MPPNRSTRSARTGEIPEHFIVNWRSSGQSGPVSPLPRRPITACEHCHAAKVRCNARQDCQRCIARRLVCTYANQTASPGSTTSGSSSQAGNGLEAWSPASPPPHVSGTQVPSQQLPPLVDMSQPAAGTADSGYMVTASTAGEYGGAINLPSVVPLGWDNTLPSVSQSGLLGSTSTSYVGDTTAHRSSYLHDNYDPLLTNSIDGGRGPTAESPTVSLTALGQQTDLPCFSKHDAACSCRPNLMIWVSKIARIMQDKRPDEILKVTGEVTRHCQDVLDCKTDEARCSDLLLIMSVLQETRPCFDFIAKSGFLEGQGGDKKVKLCFGDYEVALDNAGMRATLAMDLVQRAVTVVTSISSKGQCMINGLPEACNLAKANIAYLEANIGHFKGILACVVRHIDEAVNKDGGALDVADVLLRNTPKYQAEGRSSS